MEKCEYADIQFYYRYQRGNTPNFTNFCTVLAYFVALYELIIKTIKNSYRISRSNIVY